MDIIDRGLNLSRLDEWTPEEAEAFQAYYAQHLGAPLPAYELWARLRPDVLKRHRLQARQAGPHQGWFALLFLHFYAVAGYGEGIAYEIVNARVTGITRAQVVETLAVAFMHSGPLGMHAVEASARRLLDDYVDQPAAEPPFPADWAPDPAAFHSGIDVATPSLSPDERRSLERWYVDTLGEVPAYVRLLAEHHPGLLKVHRSRFETAIRDALPKQMMPLLLLHLHVSRGSEPGIREALQLARGFGVTRPQAIAAMTWGMLYGGSAAISQLHHAAADVLASLPDPRSAARP